jgi:hypothetical protein
MINKLFSEETMKKLLIVCLLAGSALCSMFQLDATAAGVSYTAGFDYFSNYFWRGFDWYGEGVGVFFPYLNVVLGDSGLTLGYLGEYPAEELGDGSQETGPAFPKNWYGADFGITYTKSVADTVTVAVKVWYQWYYKSAKYDKDSSDYDDSFITGTVSITIDALPLKPTLIYNHDYLMSDYGGTKEQAKDYYIQFQLKHVFQMTPEVGLTLLGGVGYYNYASAEYSNVPESKALKGFSDVGGQVDLAFTKGKVSVHGNLNYAYVPDEDYNLDGENKHRWWSGFGASLTF